MSEEENNRKEEFQRRDYLIHKVFAQSEAGKELLAVWSGEALSRSAHAEGADLYNLGRVEGKKEVVRAICLTVEKVENDR